MKGVRALPIDILGSLSVPMRFCILGMNATSIYFFFFRLHWVFMVVSRGFSCCRTGALEGGLSSALVPWLSCHASCGILVPRSGIKLKSLALEGGFSTTGQPRKSCRLHS